MRRLRRRGRPRHIVDIVEERGRLRSERLENYRRLLAELHFQEPKINPAVARRDKEKWKKIHKAMRKNPDWF